MLASPLKRIRRQARRIELLLQLTPAFAVGNIAISFGAFPASSAGVIGDC